MKEKVGQVFSIARENMPFEDYTMSKEVQLGACSINYFSLGQGTDISAEIYPYHKLIALVYGDLEVYGRGSNHLKLGEGMLTETEVPVGMRTEKGAVYVEVLVEKEDEMNKKVKAGQVFKLEDMVPYQEGKIVNLDLLHNEKMKFVIMSFDQGTGLKEHAAPGEALVFALEGRAKIGYEGETHEISAGETIHFAKGGRHWVEAEEPFKMGLLLSLEV